MAEQFEQAEQQVRGVRGGTTPLSIEEQRIQHPRNYKRNAKGQQKRCQPQKSCELRVKNTKRKQKKKEKEEKKKRKERKGKELYANFTFLERRITQIYICIWYTHTHTHFFSSYFLFFSTHSGAEKWRQDNRNNNNNNLHGMWLKKEAWQK